VKVADSAEVRDRWVKELQEVMSAAGRRRDSLRLSIVGGIGGYLAPSITLHHFRLVSWLPGVKVSRNPEI